MPPTELPRLTGSLRAFSGLSSSHSQQPEIDDLLKRKRELRSKKQLERNLSWSELKSLILDATSFDKNATQEVFTYFLPVDFKWKEYANGWWNISLLTMFTDIIGIDPYIYTILFLLWSKRVTQYDTSSSLLLLQVFVLLSGEIKIDLVKHLVLEKSETKHKASNGGAYCHWVANQ